MSLQDLTVNEALKRVLALVGVLEPTTVPLMESVGMILAADVRARDSLPPFDNSSMDGYAVVADDTVGASETAGKLLKVVGEVPAGSWPEFVLEAGQAARITTGAPIPQGATAVVPVEGTSEPWRDAERPLSEQIKIFRVVSSGDYVRPQGDDVVAGQIVLKKGHRIRPQEVSLLASLGVADVPVVRKPKVAVLATGDELVGVEEELTLGKIRNSNSLAIMANVRQLGGEAVDLGVGLDSTDSIRSKLQAAIDEKVDLIISSAGVSVGAFDVVKEVLDSGGDIDFWRVRMRPGKPLAVGKYQGIPYLGLPGNPVSSLVSFERFVRPAVLKMAGHTDLERRKISATLSEDVESDGRESYIRVRVTWEGELASATPTGDQGSHMITSLANANGLLIIPEGQKKASAGDRLTTILID